MVMDGNEAQLGELAKQVVSQRHLQDIVKAAEPSLRKQVYEQIAGHVTQFRPLPYWAAKL